MTFVVGLTSPQFAMLAADRRVTTIHPLRPTEFADRDTKIVNLNGEYLLGFAGLASIRRTEDARLRTLLMEEWIVDALASSRPGDYQASLASTANSDFPLPPTPHAFISLGFRKVSGRWIPNAVLTSNAIEEGRFAPDYVDMRFGSMVLPTHRDGLAIFAVGAESPDINVMERRASAIARFEEDAQQIYGEPHASPRLLMDRLADLVYAVSDLGSGEVGKSCLVSILPIRAVGSTEVNLLMDNEATDEMLHTLPLAINYIRDFKGIRASRLYQPAVVAQTHSVMGVVGAPGRTREIGPRGFDLPIGSE